MQCGLCGQLQLEMEQLDCQTIGKSMVYFGAQRSFQFSCLVASYRLSHHKE